MSESNPREPVTTDDLRASAGMASNILGKLTTSDWIGQAANLEWTRKQTAAHVVRAYAHYILSLANLATERPPGLVSVPDSSTPEEILAGLPLWGEVLANIASASPSNARAYHGWGYSDAEGFLAMGCAETLVHFYDISLGITEIEMPTGIVERVVRRLFPWAPIESDPWCALLWSTGRAEIDGFESPGAGWVWHNEPLEEWDGTVKVKSSLLSG